MPKNDLTADSFALFNFRVLLRHDTKYGVQVAHCIETGSVVTAETQDEASEMMKELLEDELSFAIRHRNMKNLFSSPAPLEVFLQWMAAALREKPKTVNLDVDVDFSQLEHPKIEPQNAHLTNTAQFALAA